MTSIMSSLVKGTMNSLSWLQVQGRLSSFHDTVRNTPLLPVTALTPRQRICFVHGHSRRDS